MNIREEFSILRGCPIDLLPDAATVPCRETSDPERLCKHPVVSVHMMAYNHEPYIRQAIEGVIMQKTGFEYELIIGEDCSTDKTREICFEYQKRFPEKIRVLWSESNVFAINGNEIRIKARCRGEFIAICEGDDYWTDPLKLQKQVDIMRTSPNVTLCFTGADIWDTTSNRHRPWNKAKNYDMGLIKGAEFASIHLWGRDPNHPGADGSFVVTASTLIRRSSLEKAFAEIELMRWSFWLSDSQMWLALASLGDVYNLSDETAVYRRNEGGLTETSMGKVGIDATLVRLYFSTEVFHGRLPKIPTFWLNSTAVSLLSWQRGKSRADIRFAYRQILTTRYANLLTRLWSLPVRVSFLLGIASSGMTDNLRRLYNHKLLKIFY